MMADPIRCANPMIMGPPRGLLPGSAVVTNPTGSRSFGTALAASSLSAHESPEVKYGKAAAVASEAGRQARLHPAMGPWRAHPDPVRHFPAARLQLSAISSVVFITGGHDMRKLLIAIGIV